MDHTRDCSTRGMLAVFFIFFEITIVFEFIGIVATTNEKVDPNIWWAVFIVLHLIYYVLAGLITLCIYAIYGCYLMNRHKPRVELMDPLSP